MRHYQNFIAGQFVEAKTDAVIEVINPATGAPFATVSLATDADVIEAASRAAMAQRAWGRLPSIERGNALRRLADLLERQADKIGAALAEESGKSLADATAEVGYGVELMRYHAEWARRIEGELIDSDTPNETLMLQRVPIGVVACLIPFNFPIYTLVRKIAPALIAGNAVVVRPSNTTPTSAFAFAEAVAEAGLPEGLISILTMRHDVAATLCRRSEIGMITLTGSVAAGQAVLEFCKDNIAKPSLELGGKTPVIVEPDADLDAVAKSLLAAKTAHCGQVCTSVERLYVHASVHDALLEKLKAGFAARGFGDRATDASLMGPLASQTARRRVHALVEQAIQEGAKLKAGGTCRRDRASSIRRRCSRTAGRTCRSSARRFWAGATVIAYSDFDEALRLASDSPFGLASVLYSNDYGKVMRATNSIEAGELYINRFPADPYQGYHAGWKRSGLGGDDGKHGMLEFTQTRLVILKH